MNAPQEVKTLVPYCLSNLVSSKKKVAFTIAEVLITLAIIGVVAALTILNLVVDYQKKVYVNQLRKSYSLWSNVYKTIMAEEGVSSLSDTSVFKSIKEKCSYGVWTQENCKEFYVELNKYIKISPQVLTKDYPSSSFDDSSNLIGYGKTNSIILLADGSSLTNFLFRENKSSYIISCDEINAKGSRFCNSQGSFYIDVNGLKGPNKLGRDVFYFLLSDDGILYPYGGKEVSIYIRADALRWNTYHTYCGVPEENGTVSGEGCAARVIEEGWKMNY